jgi:hypothetical protein
LNCKIDIFKPCVLFQLLSKSLDVVDNEDWIAELGDMFGQQIPMYNNYPEEKVQ